MWKAEMRKDLKRFLYAVKTFILASFGVDVQFEDED